MYRPSVPSCPVVAVRPLSVRLRRSRRRRSSSLCPSRRLSNYYLLDELWRSFAIAVGDPSWRHFRHPRNG